MKLEKWPRSKFPALPCPSYAGQKHHWAGLHWNSWYVIWWQNKWRPTKVKISTHCSSIFKGHYLVQGTMGRINGERLGLGLGLSTTAVRCFTVCITQLTCGWPVVSRVSSSTYDVDCSFHLCMIMETFEVFFVRTGMSSRCSVCMC